MRKDYLSLAVFLALSLSAGVVGSLFTAASVSGWYAELEKPVFTPPSWIFAPVWTALYVLMAVSGWLLWRRRKESDIRAALGLFAVQLVLNVLWSVLFFGLRLPGWAFLEIIVLWLAIALYSAAAARVSRAASLLFLPYLAWVGYAAVLNYSIWTLNW